MSRPPTRVRPTGARALGPAFFSLTYPRMHLVCLHHGLWGNGDNLETLCDIISNHAPPHIRIYNCLASERTKTLDGIDMCGDRFIVSLRQKVIELEHGQDETVTHISFIGYSMGGLIGQYAIGKLFSEGFFDSVKLLNVVMLATPRLGAHVHSAKGWGPRDSIFNIIAPVISSRSGYQMFFDDSWSEKPLDRPLLTLMSDPLLPWFQALKRAKKLINMSNIQFDTMVGYRISSMLDESPFEQSRGWFWWYHGSPTKGLKEGYPSIVVPPSDSRGREEWGHPRSSVVEGLWFQAIMVVLFLPLLPLALILLPMSIIKGWLHYRSFPPPPGYNSWLSNVKINADGPGLESASGSVEDINVIVADSLKCNKPIPRSRVACQELVRDSLMTLAWQQIDVDSRHCWAHAAIVVRHPSRFKNRDQLLYLVKEAMEW